MHVVVMGCFRSVFGSQRLAQMTSYANANNGGDGSTVAESLQFDELCSTIDDRDETSTIITTTTAQTTSYSTKDHGGSRRESFWKRTFIGSSSSTTTQAPSGAVNTTSSPPSMTNPSSTTPTSSTNQSTAAPARIFSHDYLENLLDYNILPSTNPLLAAGRPSLHHTSSMHNIQALTGAGLVAPNPSNTVIFVGNNKVEQEVLQTPSQFYELEEDDSLLFTRTYYHHMSNLNAFLQK